MVYDWEGKEDICYRMYIVEKRSLEDIMEHLKAAPLNFAPRYCRSLLFLPSRVFTARSPSLT